MIWRNPLAWLGLATLLVPIAIHLLVRQQAQPLAFPSLRFLRASRLAAVKRRRLSDWLLLALRLLILAAAVAALADPFFASERRRAEWASRVARVILVDAPAGASAANRNAARGASATAGNAAPSANASARAAANAPANARASDTGSATGGGAINDADSSTGARVDAVNGASLDPALAAAAQAEAASAFASAVFATPDLQRGVTHALAWLASAPPAAREIVIVSPLTRGRVTPAIAARLPAHVGLRFTRVGATEEQRRAEGRPASTRLDAAGAGAATRAGDTFATRTPIVTVQVDRTDVQWRSNARAASGDGGNSTALSTEGGNGTGAGADRSRVASPAHAASAGTVRNTAAAPAAATAAPAAPPTFDIITEPAALMLRALGLRVEAAPRDLGAARAALDAVLAQGVPVAGQSSRPLIVAIGDAARAHAATTAATPAAAEPPPRVLTAPWMADALDAIGADEALGDAIGSSEAGGPDSAVAGSTVGGGARPLVLFRAIDGTPLVTARAARVTHGSGAASTAAPSSQTSAADAAAATIGAPESATAAPAAAAGGIRATDAASSNASATATRATAADALVIASRAPADSDVTALLLRAALRATADRDPLPRAEVARIPDAQLAAWQRPAGLPPMTELTRVESHDRRWFWAAALLLLLVERIARTRMRRRDPSEPASPEVAHAA